MEIYILTYKTINGAGRICGEPKIYKAVTDRQTAEREVEIAKAYWKGFRTKWEITESRLYGIKEG